MYTNFAVMGKKKSVSYLRVLILINAMGSEILNYPIAARKLLTIVKMKYVKNQPQPQPQPPQQDVTSTRIVQLDQGRELMS